MVDATDATLVPLLIESDNKCVKDKGDINGSKVAL